MIRKLVLIFAVSIIGISAQAINADDLNPEFFARFNDDCLVYYINEALLNNHDAKQATARVEQYRQQAKYSLGNELPSFSVSANYLGIKIPELDDFQLKENAFALPFMASYEADFLLKNRDKTRSAKKAYEANQYSEKASYIALLSDTATVYINILQYDELVNIQSEIADISLQILNTDYKKFDRGVINTTDLNNSIENYENAKNNLENYVKQRDVLLMQLAVLTGQSSDCMQDMKRGSLQALDYTSVIPDEVDSDVIFARPDVMASEKNLEKAKIDIRVARKEFLPTFNITGIWAFNTMSPGTFFSWESSLAAIIAGASQDIFTGGKKVANLRLQKAKYEELFENYKQTSLEAVKEVNTSLCFIKHDREIADNTQSKLDYEQKNFDNTQKRFNRGVISQSDYLNAKSKLLTQEIDAANSKTQNFVDYFTLYKAVGGKL